MNRKLGTVLAVAALAASPLLADFSFQQTSTITGGMMQSMMKVAGVFNKQATEPVHATIAVKGDRMVHRSQTSASIIDLASQTITNIDLQKKTYSVMTFAEMKQLMEQASQHKAGQPEMTFKVSVNDTGKTKSISGLDTHEMIVKMEMQNADTRSEESGSMVITTDMWIAPATAGYPEIRDFYRKMAEKLDWSPEGGMFMSRPDVAKGMAEVYKESAKLNGMPVFETITMGGPGQQGATASSNAPAPQQQSQQQTQQQTQASPSRPSLGGALGGALGGKLGLGRKPAEPSSPPPPPAPSGSASTSTTGSSSPSLLEMTTEMSAFSASTVDNSLFEIPAGFKKVETKTGR